MAKVNAMVGRVRETGAHVEACTRYPQCPRSMVSVVFYETLLRAGDDGFTKLPASFHLTEEQPTKPPPDPVPLRESLIVRVIELSKRTESKPQSALLSAGSVAPPSALL